MEHGNLKSEAMFAITDTVWDQLLGSVTQYVEDPKRFGIASRRTDSSRVLSNLGAKRVETKRHV